MELVRLVAMRSRSVALRDEYLAVEYDLGKYLGDDVRGQVVAHGLCTKVVPSGEPAADRTSGRNQSLHRRARAMAELHDGVLNLEDCPSRAPITYGD